MLVAGGEDLEAPEPIARPRNERVARASREEERTAQNMGEAVTNDRATAPRREGRERMRRDGWEPISGAPSESPSSPTRRQLSSDQTPLSESRGGVGQGSELRGNEPVGSESPVRKRYRDAKERRHPESVAGLEDNEDPFDDRQATPSATDLAHSESPFHAEN